MELTITIIGKYLVLNKILSYTKTLRKWDLRSFVIMIVPLTLYSFDRHFDSSNII